MFKSKKSVYCSAGISYALIYPNGDVYRCMADYNDNRPPLFNAKNGWKFIDRPMLCTHEKCYAACDIDWATKWIFEDNKKEPQVIDAQAANVSQIDGKFWGGQTFDNPLKNRIHIVWTPSLLCNYTCRYCGCAVGAHSIYKDFQSSCPELSIDDWIRIWSDINKHYDYGNLTTSGGEPLLARAALPVLEMISEKFSIWITTNLSVSVLKIARSAIKKQVIKDGNRTGLSLITASLHPTAKEFQRDAFFGSILFLKNNGFNVYVNFVGHPLQLYLAPEYKKWCDEHGITFYVSPWCGSDNDGITAGYTEEDQNFLNKIAPVHKKTDTQIMFFQPRCSVDIGVKEISVNKGQNKIIQGKAVNTGDCSWMNEYLAQNSAFKAGFKIFNYGENAKPLKEFRAPLPAKEIVPGEVCDFKAELDIADLSAGVYTLEADILKEGNFWFKDKNCQPLRLTLRVS